MARGMVWPESLPYPGPLYSVEDSIFHIPKGLNCLLFKAEVQAAFFTSLSKALQTKPTAIRLTNAF